MLRNLKDLEGFSIHAIDGDLGHVKDFYFDDERWVIRYLVVDTGTWLSSRKVLISPIAVGRPLESEKRLPVSITMAQVSSSPDIDTERPVSRQQELYHLLHYGYPQYWDGVGLWGNDMHPAMVMPEFSSTPVVVEPHLDHPPSLAEVALRSGEDSHLRAFNSVKGNHILASDGDIGHVQGLLVDEETWAIRYLIVDTGAWWPGQQVLIAPQWIERVSWSDETVSVHLTRQSVKDAPAYDPVAGVDRQDEAGIQAQHGHAGDRINESDGVRISSPR